MKTGTVFAHFVRHDEARKTLRSLRRKGFRRAACVSKGTDGRIHIRDLFPWYRFLAAGMAAILFACLGAAISLGLHWWGSVPVPSGSVLIPAVASAFIGILLSLVWISRSRFGIERTLIEQARRLLSEESVLILQGPTESLRIPVTFLRESGEIQPAVFVLLPLRKGPAEGSWSPRTLLSPVQLQEQARRLAAEDQVDPKPLRDTELLQRVERSRRRIQQSCQDLSEAGRMEQSMPPTAEWLLDNEYILESNARDVQLNLPGHYYRQLPALASGPNQGFPRIYGLAQELAAHSDLRLDEANILAFIEAYQSVGPLSIGELWAVPQMLRVVLIEGIQHLADRALTELHEGEIADLWAGRLIAATRHDPNRLFSVLAELTEAHPSPSPYFASQLIDYLYDEAAASAPVQSWLERVLQGSLGDLGLREKNRQSKDQISIGNAFTSLRQLALLDWKECFEQLSWVEKLLRQDPAGIYPRMDFATRDRYRRAVEDLHRGSGLAEDQVAQSVLDLAAEPAPESPSDEGASHVGTHLIGEKRTALARLIGCRETLRFRALHWAYRHHSAIYFCGLASLSAAFIFLPILIGLRGQAPGLQFLIALLLLVPASQLSLEVVNYLIGRLFPPRTLPKMDFRECGVPDTCRTLVVVPMMLIDTESIQAEAEKLEIRYLANREANLLFALYSDYRDAEQAHCESDEELLQTAVRCIEALNQRYGERFFLLHRERKWCNSEQKYIGWERKRGKLEELNQLIAGTRPPEAGRLVHVGNPDQISHVRFVITLDTDTQLPHDTARRMIESLAHPLNVPRFDDKGRVMAGSYSIIQPRVSPSLPSANGSAFSRLFSDPVGIDPYTRAVSDVNQDLAGAGSYHGKGIYDPRTFSRVLSGRFPEARLLSHDLIEGAHVRVGLASDIELYDEFPQDYLTFCRRMHRWIRGDWQIAAWILPRVPQPGGRSGPNPLSWFDRWKIFDNLRRSLLPAASVLLLLVSWLISSSAGWTATAIVAIQLLFHSLAQPFTWATTRRERPEVSPAKSARNLLRVIVEAALLPYQAWQALDAIVRVWYRRLISHRGLLEWHSAQATNGETQSLMPMFLRLMGLVSLFSMLMAWAIQHWRPENLGVAGPWLILWFLSPLIGWLLSRRPQAKHPQYMLPAEDRQFLRNAARRTWRYFSDFVNEETAWLPPDNYQVSHRNQLAMRTSPTNIGVWMASVLGAHDFGYLTIDGVTERLSGTIATVSRLERYEGHLLNWYEIPSLAPLKPRYVSTVDSGNLLGALWVLDQGLKSLIQAPLLDTKAFAGLWDTGDILRQTACKESSSHLDVRALNDLLRAWESPPDHLADQLLLLRAAELSVEKLAGEVRTTTAQTGTAYWLGELQSQLAAWRSTVDRYLAWIETLAEPIEEEVVGLAPGLQTAVREVLQHAPSLEDLAQGNLSAVRSLQEIRKKGPSTGHPALDRIDRALEAFSRSKWLAGEALASVQRVLRASRELSESINMRFLYHVERRLFSIGFNVSEGRLDRAYYDLLASEARLGSFVAIARGDVPVEHWFAMSRPYGAIGRGRALLSWTGSMFEYLMPLLFQRSYGNSLLDQASREAVAIQIAYGRRLRVPWGVSESAFGDLDSHKTYQYRAFGVPELGLKRGLAEKIVIAPYATLLALSITPRKAVRNLRRLDELGLLNDYGYFEALDYSRQPSRDGRQGVIVRAYMAHHQGMGFLSLTNFLNDHTLQRHFHADPRVRAVEPLLHERVPHLPPLQHTATRERVSTVAGIGEVAPSVSQFETPHTTTPKTQILCNDRYGLMLSTAGGGYSRWGDFEITRWRSDGTRDAWGTFCYVHDTDSDHLWCTGYHPIGGNVEGYSAAFSLDRALFRRVDSGIESETEVIVTPEDDAEIRRITLINRTARTRRLDLTSYVELALAPHNADRQHPAFNKLFIQTEMLPEQHALLAYRRPRSGGDPPIYVGHRFTLETTDGKSLRFETDRRRFIGRGRTLRRPMGALQEPGKSHGFVLDPILSLRQSVILAPNRRARVSLVLAAGESREQIVSLMDKYGDLRAIDRAMDLAWAAAQLELRLLRIQPEEARRFQQLASHLLYPNPLLRSRRIAENRKDQTGLWASGISGDLPIALVAIGEARDLGLVRQMLQAHTYWRMHGLVADLVILNEEPVGYEQPLREQLERMIQSVAAQTGTDRPGGVYLRSAELVAPEDLTLLGAVASIVMVAARGSLLQQLSAVRDASDSHETIEGKRDAVAEKRKARDPSAALPFLELPFFNSLGGFTQDGREYAVYLGPGVHTPAPWTNIIANPSFGTLISETGAGFTWQGNSQRNRLTEWSNDPVIDPPSEAIYIRDEDTGAYWTPTASPIREESAYRARHGTGYTVFEHNSHGIEQELTVFVPVDDRGGEPIKLQRLTLHNDTGRPRNLSLTYYVEWTLGEARESSQMHVVTAWDDQVQALLARNCYHPDYGDRLAFAAVSLPVQSYTADRTAFLGRNRSMGDPAAMEYHELSGRTGAGLDPCAALQVRLKLAPGQRIAITCMLGQVQSVEQARSLILTYRNGPTTETALRQTQAWWDDRLGIIQVHTPELAADFMINRWLQYQNLGCRIWGRSAFYQSGGAFGFRDQLQDVMAWLYAYPELAREQILLAASRQFKEGDVQHWWHPPGGAGIRSRISDDLLWLPHVVAQYIRVTADVDILNEMVPFLEAPVLSDDQHESFQSPEVSLERATLFEHCRRALVHSQRFGAQGLPLMGTGDWNDGMNLVGAEGRGQSVWLAWFMADVLEDMAEMADLLSRPDLGGRYREDREVLVQRVEGFAWDGEWYLRATFDDGTLLGSSANSEAQIDSLPQSWAWLSGAADRDRAERALESAWRRLVREDEGLVLLLEPPFDRSDPSPGYIQGYPPGVRENGGQYTHAALWLAMAMARRGEGNRAGKILRMLNPIEHSRDPKSVWRYGLEPYVVAGDVYRLPKRIGQGGWSWYTGSAAWMYRAWVEEILGLKVRGETLRINPVIPGWWDGFRMSYRHAEATYEIQIENPGHHEQGIAWIELDGRRVEGGGIPLDRNLIKHRVRVRMGRPASG